LVGIRYNPFDMITVSAQRTEQGVAVELGLGCVTVMMMWMLASDR